MNDIVARFSTSSIVIAGLGTEEEARFKLPNLMRITNKPYVINEENIFTTVKVGIALFQKEQTDYEELIRFADTALTVSKKTVGNALNFFEHEQSEEAKEK